MSAIIRHELRRLLPLALVLLGAAVLFGLMDVGLNARRVQFLGISFYYCLVLAAFASFGGAYFARTGNNPESRFLGLWPVSRLRVVLVRVSLYLVLGALTVLLSFLISGGILRLGGHDPWQILFGDVLYEPFFLPVGLTLLALIFSLTLLWSQMLEAALSVLLVLVTGAGLTGGLVWLATYYLPAYHGPRLALVVGAALTESGVPTVAAWTMAVLAVLTLAAAILGAVRAPLLETKRRAGLSLISLTVLLAVALIAGLLVAFPLTQPRGIAVPGANGVTSRWVDAEVDGTGRHVVLSNYSPDARLWAVDLQSGQSRLLSRAGSDWVETTASGEKAAFEAYGHVWMADLKTGRLRRLPDISYGPTCMSPTGRYWLNMGPLGPSGPAGPPVISDGHDNIPLGAGTMVLGWTADERAAYALTNTPDRSLLRISLPDGAVWTVARHLPLISPWQPGLSPSGKWLAVETPSVGLRPRPQFALISTSTGNLRAFDGFPTGAWSADDRYLWSYDPSQNGRVLSVLDTQTMAFVRIIGSRQLAGRYPGLPHVDPQHRRVYFRAGLRGQPGHTYWAADVSGANLREIGFLNAALWGVAADGSLVMGDNSSLFLWNPQTLEKQVLVGVMGSGGEAAR